jgi:hypothetical protein
VGRTFCTLPLASRPSAGMIERVHAQAIQIEQSGSRSRPSPNRASSLGSGSDRISNYNLLQTELGHFPVEIPDC